MRFSNQVKRQMSVVLNHCMEHGSIANRVAYENYNISRLAAVIFSLKKLGHVFETVIGSDRKATYFYRGTLGGES